MKRSDSDKVETKENLYCSGHKDTTMTQPEVGSISRAAYLMLHIKRPRYESLNLYSHSLKTNVPNIHTSSESQFTICF